MDDLVVEDGLAEDLALARVGDGFVDRALHAGQGDERGVHALFLELHHLIGEAEAFLADAETLRHAHVVEMDLRRVARMHAEFLQRARDGHALRLHRQTDQRLVAVDGAVAGVGEQAHPIGLRAVGRPHLAAVDDVVAAVFARGRFDRRDVGAGADFRDAEAGDVFTADRGTKEFLAHVIGAEAG